jgi:hypothetical protein
MQTDPTNAPRSARHEPDASPMGASDLREGINDEFIRALGSPPSQAPSLRSSAHLHKKPPQVLSCLPPVGWPAQGGTSNSELERGAGSTRNEGTNRVTPDLRSTENSHGEPSMCMPMCANVRWKLDDQRIARKSGKRRILTEFRMNKKRPIIALARPTSKTGHLSQFAQIAHEKQC